MLIKYLESRLGEIESGFRLQDRKEHLSVAKFTNKPANGIETYFTLGLSNSTLIKESKEYYMELCFLAESRYPPGDCASFLLSFSEYLISKKQALLRGEIVQENNPIIEGTEMNAVYVSIPVFLEENFDSFTMAQKTIIFVWLIPLYTEEALFIQNHGWDVFEDHLEKDQVWNFWNLNRARFPFIK